jgi:hypothetical protein
MAYCALEVSVHIVMDGEGIQASPVIRALTLMDNGHPMVGRVRKTTDHFGPGARPWKKELILRRMYR